MQKDFYVYILASERNGTLYIGVTSNLIQRIYQHKMHFFDGFTASHNVIQLVYYEKHYTAESAIRRENRLKFWKRKWKLSLIEKSNPDWNDLYAAITE